MCVRIRWGLFWVDELRWEWAKGRFGPTTPAVASVLGMRRQAFRADAEKRQDRKGPRIPSRRNFPTTQPLFPTYLHALRHVSKKMGRTQRPQNERAESERKIPNPQIALQCPAIIDHDQVLTRQRLPKRTSRVLIERSSVSEAGKLTNEKCGRKRSVADYRNIAHAINCRKSSHSNFDPFQNFWRKDVSMLGKKCTTREPTFVIAFTKFMGRCWSTFRTEQVLDFNVRK